MCPSSFLVMRLIRCGGAWLYAAYGDILWIYLCFAYDRTGTLGTGWVCTCAHALIALACAAVRRRSPTWVSTSLDNCHARTWPYSVEISIWSFASTISETIDNWPFELKVKDVTQLRNNFDFCNPIRHSFTHSFFRVLATYFYAFKCLFDERTCGEAWLHPIYSTIPNS